MAANWQMISIKSVATMAAVAAAGAGSATILAPPAIADDGYNASIAYSPSTGVVGVSWNYSDIFAGKYRALAECENNSLHPGDCTWVGGVTAPGRCVAIAIGPDKGQYGLGADVRLQAAKDKAQRDNPGGGAAAVWTCNGSDQPPEQGASLVWPEL